MAWSNNSTWCFNGTSALCTAPAPDPLTDYGTPANLLECVPTYQHKVPSLNAANAYMMAEVMGFVVV